MNKKYLFSVIGFLAGVTFYLFDVMVSNSEVSSIEATANELLRNINYFMLFIYGIIGFIMMYILITTLNKLIK
ncbi:conserved hypothetical protein [Capnocytophaga canimorsus]|uniref:Uncharacterized protein n=1 Tax=Capnocytophaga canimorsus TaxID=28188 RepID=A0A0B7HHH5_9FLAO|nr:hypothetical protein CGC47_05665 [Capnocytophaga canimorsus]PJI83753.1 hypothetical protein CLV61_0360 [Capnocytophaga canimorsus]CEN37342.1 conserved hypothetical protein [Capnocytophaga canimorsus]STA72321.1 Uncharacterised protein [Capnocytophaga canimorsus]